VILKVAGGDSRLEDPICGRRPLSKLSVFTKAGTTPSESEILYHSNNERTSMSYNHNPSNSDKVSYYPLGAEDRLSAQITLMNTNREDKTVYVAVTYDYVQDIPSWWRAVKTVYIRATGACDLSKFQPLREETAFELLSQAWKPTLSGRVAGIYGFLDPGATDMLVRSRDDKIVCRMTAKYGATSDYKAQPLSSSIREPTIIPADDQISSMSACPPDLGNMTRSQSWDIVGRYDFLKHPGDERKDGYKMPVGAAALIMVEES
jgi:hypothetical protein